MLFLYFEIPTQYPYKDSPSPNLGRMVAPTFPNLDKKNPPKDKVPNFSFADIMVEDS